jgi:NAD-dependent dihydropyrimidine dehydrogenase PreA subunit
MTYVITKLCAGTCNGACLDVCPVDAIAGPIDVDVLRATPAIERGKRFAELQLFIDPDECICCGACAEECPASAIYEIDSVPAEHRDDIERNAAFFRTR